MLAASLRRVPGGMHRALAKTGTMPCPIAFAREPHWSAGFHLHGRIAALTHRPPTHTAASWGPSVGAHVRTRPADRPPPPAPPRFRPRYDIDSSGAIDRYEFGLMVRDMCVPLTDDELDDAFAEMDEDGSGEIDIDEFKGW